MATKKRECLKCGKIFKSEIPPTYNRICGDCKIENKRARTKSVSLGGKVRVVDRGMP